MVGGLRDSGMGGGGASGAFSGGGFPVPVSAGGVCGGFGGDGAAFVEDDYVVDVHGAVCLKFLEQK